MGDIIAGAAKTSAKYVGKVGRFIATNGEAIKTGAAIVKDLVSTGSTIAQISGLIHPDTKSSIDSIADAVSKHLQLYGAKPKKGGYFGKIMI